MQLLLFAPLQKRYGTVIVYRGAMSFYVLVFVGMGTICWMVKQGHGGVEKVLIGVLLAKAL